MRSLFKLLLIACVLANLSGCGQKGPLVLPEDAPAKSTAP
jgi:predicted small lipoprotein YifL